MLKRDHDLTEVNFSIFPHQQFDCNFHKHRYFELVYIVDGEALHIIKGEHPVRVKTGDYFIVNTSDYHRYQMTFMPEVSIINVLFRADFIVPSVKDGTDFSEIMNNFVFKSGNVNYRNDPTRCIFYDEDGSVKKTITAMLDEYTKEKQGYLEMIRSYLLEIIIRTMRTIVTESRKIKSKTVSKVIEYANENFSSNASLAEISSMLQLTPQYVSSKFSKECKMTFTEYLRKLRINHACRLLISTTMSVNEISIQSGYKDIKTFNKIFKASTGDTPRSFRKKSL